MGEQQIPSGDGESLGDDPYADHPVLSAIPREVRQQAHSLDLIFENRTDPETGMIQYRVTARPTVEGTAPRWACHGCGRIVSQPLTQPTIDPRWRVAPCPVCKQSGAIYEQVGR